MINEVNIYHITGKRLFSSSFTDKRESQTLEENIITAIVKKTSEAESKIAYLTIGTTKIIFRIEGEIASVIFSDKDDIETVLEDYAYRIIKRYRLRYGDSLEGVPEDEMENFASILKRLITSPTIALKIVMIGEPNTGKTSILKILSNEEPSKIYIPSTDASGNTFSDITTEAVVNLWDLPGREEHRWLWERHTIGCDIILIVTDSTTPNLLSTMETWGLFKDHVDAKVAVVGLANMQDKKEALDPNIVSNILGFKTYPIISKSLENRKDILNVFKEICENYILHGLEEKTSEVNLDKNQILENITSIKSGLERLIPPNHPILISINGWIERIKSKSELSDEEFNELDKAVKNWTAKLEELIKG
ncbi:MAG: ADP-ribosylation factor-like protein [Candidatus Odinarchaeota archaeon]